MPRMILLASFTRLLFLLSCCAPLPTVTAAEKPQTERGLTYERDVRPILKAHCFQCHGEEPEPEGGLDLRLRRLIVTGGESGPALVAGKPEESPLIERIRSAEMPPGDKKVGEQELATLTRWISEGAKTARPEPESIGEGLQITEDERSFWAFQPIRRPAVPEVAQGEQVRTPIDAFLLRKLESKQLSFSPEADKRTLIRRATFDLIGLPPTPDEIEQFLSDDSSSAYERLIDRLLDSPHYGERWGRHWLDVAGYADSEGYTNDDPIRGSAFRYRDYVIRAFNHDKPFDKFIQEQLAGDEMLPQPYENLSKEQIEMLSATGFLRMAPDGTGSEDVEQDVARNQVIADTIQIVTSSLLGLSVACAQCHDHRYDPIPQSDYYRLRAVFEPAYDWKKWRPPASRRISLFTAADREQVKQIEARAAEVLRERKQKEAEYIEQTFQKELAKLPQELREPVRIARNSPAKERTEKQKLLLKEYPSVNVSAGSLYLYDSKAAKDLKSYVERADKIRATKPLERFIRAMTEVPGEVPQTHLFYRGDHRQPRETVEPSELTVLASLTDQKIPVNDESLATTGRRWHYAKHLTSRSHPLTARVLVNRFWVHHFGRGIVGTPADFGQLGERPTHPELLDWLADEFMAGGWRLKRLHRLMMLSAAYRQSSVRSTALDTVDPDNRLYGRKTIQRLQAETLRDSVLAISGHLNRKMFGPPVPVMENDVGQFVLGIEKKNGENRQTEFISLHEEEFRRSVYVQVRRSRPLGVLDTFDAPRMEPNCEIRTASTVAPQSLMLMNSTFAVERSADFAQRVIDEAGHLRQRQIALAWLLVFGKRPSDEESERAIKFLASQQEHFQSKYEKKGDQAAGRAESAALAGFCQALFSSNGFLYVD